MHTLRLEVEQLESRTGARTPASRRAWLLESRAVFTVRPQLLLAFYAAVALIVGGVGVFVRRYHDQLGPLTLGVALLAGSLAAYGAALWLRTRRHGRDTLAAEYLPLLGALLLSSAVGYLEYRYRWLGDAWSRHLLLLALLHAAAAYAFRSRLVLGVALTALASWFGIESALGHAWDVPSTWWGFGGRALACAALILGLRALHLRLQGPATLTPVFEQFAANLAFWGALGLSFQDPSRLVGVAIVAALAIAAWRIGMAQRRESFVVYAIGYAAICACGQVGRLLPGPFITPLVCLLIVIAAAVTIWRTRARMQAEGDAT